MTHLPPPARALNVSGAASAKAILQQSNCCSRTSPNRPFSIQPLMLPKALFQLGAAALSVSVSSVHAGDSFLVENGQPRAEIVISDKPQRSTRLAAQELQDGVL